MVDFKIGDLVQLKSGGPSMTVAALQGNGEVGCTWFDDKERVQRDSFPLAALAPYTPLTLEDIGKALA